MDADQINELKDSIEYYINDNQSEDFQEDEMVYADLEELFAAAEVPRHQRRAATETPAGGDEHADQGCQEEEGR